MIAVQMFLVAPVVKRVGERGAVLLGAAAGALGFAIYAFAPNGLVYCLAIPVFALVGLMQPGLQGLMTRRVGPTHQGQLQGYQPILARRGVDDWTDRFRAGASPGSRPRPGAAGGRSRFRPDC